MIDSRAAAGDADDDRGEHEGLRRLTRERCDYLVTIERTGAIASLNVSAAAAVLLAALR